jgi:quinol monooxygenase YgiN
MIQARVTIFTPPTLRDEIVRSILTLIEASQLDSACLSCRLYVDAKDPNVVTLLEEWATRMDMERRMRSPAYGQLLQVMELSRKQPETVLHAIEESYGLEAVEKARTANN